ncbi:MAG TPA: class I SAM-dependent methyltransferase [Burkholderiales bacterium]|nr:class I SAM-dependent methyltransferase [Burkholderiales bacterium]
MNPISNTAYYCCGVRMDDAERTPSLCDDHYARRFMDAHGLEVFAPFRTETMPNILNITRCRIVDDLVRRELARERATTVVSIGAGFDTRPYRFSAGRWVELDEPQVIDVKNAKLPAAECPNPLTRLGIRFATDSLATTLAPHAGAAPTLVLIEGVFMYLEPAAIEATLRAVRQVFPRHLLVCDLMNRRFFDKFAYRMHRKIVATGASFTRRPDDPAAQFVRHDYRLTARIPMILRAVEFGVLQQRTRIPNFLARLMPRVSKDINGYAVHCFEM